MEAPNKSGVLGRIRLGRILSIATLLTSVVALVLALKKPQPVAPRQTPAAIAANAQSFQNKVTRLEEARDQGQSGSEVRLTAEEIGAAIAQSQKTAAPPTASAQPASSGTPAPETPNPATVLDSLDPGSLGEPIVSFEGDIVRGQFVAEVGGRKTYVTIAGHLGAKDGYATFDPTEFKVGDLSVPVSLVNDALQKKMLEQRDRLKLPDFVTDLRVENGELVIKQK